MKTRVREININLLVIIVEYTQIYFERDKILLDSNISFFI